MQTNEALRDQSPEVRNAVASGWMKRGIALLNEHTEASLNESLRWFERAIELRGTLPLQENPWYRYVLAAGWMNRGDALTWLGSPENLAEGVRSYDAALPLLQTLDLVSNPLFRKRLALAWMNRGITLHAQGTPSSWRAALDSFDNSIAVLRESEDDREILSLALTNRGNTLLALDPSESMVARGSVEEALTLIAGHEKEDVIVAEAGLTARYVLCRAIAFQFTENSGTGTTQDSIAAATDAVEEGIALARHWETRGENRFRKLAAELFRFGARIYQAHQAHFLTEFLLENLDPSQSVNAFPVDAKMHSAADDAIARAFAEIQRDGFAALNTPHFDRFLKMFGQLRATEARLRQLRAASPASLSA
jgi:hypothetical protein